MGVMLVGYSPIAILLYEILVTADTAGMVGSLLQCLLLGIITAEVDVPKFLERMIPEVSQDMGCYLSILCSPPIPPSPIPLYTAARFFGEKRYRKSGIREGYGGQGTDVELGIVEDNVLLDFEEFIKGFEVLGDLGLAGVGVHIPLVVLGSSIFGCSFAVADADEEGSASVPQVKAGGFCV
jgi:hypothetical protein